jgi:hypothetical protein
MTETTTTPPPSGRGGRRSLPILLIGALAVLLCLVVVVLVFVLGLRPLLFPTRVEGIPLEIVRVTPGPTPQAGSPSLPIAEVGGEAVTLPVPIVLQIGERTFPVQASPADSGAWLAPASASGAAIWVEGTVVNYVLGLEGTAEQTALVEQLAAGDQVLLRLSNGTAITFRVTGRESVPPDDTSIFAQHGSGLTLLLLGGEAETRTAILAEVERVEEPTPDPAAVTIAAGQPTQVGDALITVERGHAEPASADAPPGTMVYLVEFALQNTGAAPLDARTFVMELVDSLGNRYLPSSSAAMQGDYGPLLRALNPGESVNGTAGYVVPELLSGPSLTWIFSPDAQVRAYFALPYEQPATALPAADVDVYDAFLDEDEGTLHILADIYNDGDAPLEVTAADISLSSRAGAGTLRLTAPPLPWTIPAHGSQDVELVFAQPDASSAVVTILGFAFEITGLP